MTRKLNVGPLMIGALFLLAVGCGGGASLGPPHPVDEYLTESHKADLTGPAKCFGEFPGGSFDTSMTQFKEGIWEGLSSYQDGSGDTLSGSPEEIEQVITDQIEEVILIVRMSFPACRRLK